MSLSAQASRSVPRRHTAVRIYCTSPHSSETWYEGLLALAELVTSSDGTQGIALRRFVRRGGPYLRRAQAEDERRFGPRGLAHPELWEERAMWIELAWIGREGRVGLIGQDRTGRAGLRCPSSRCRREPDITLGALVDKVRAALGSGRSQLRV